MFRGIFHSSMDEKGRTSVPARFRDVLAQTFKDEQMVVTRAVPVDLSTGEVCRGLTLYPYTQWLELESRVAQSTEFSSRQLNAIKRGILAHGAECIADKQGRILIPPLLREYGNLDKDVVFVGSLTKVEIWNKDVWAKVDQASEMDLPLDMPELAKLGL